MPFGEKLNNLRKREGMSQEDFAAKIGVSRQAVSRWESGKILPDAENLIKISKLFGVSTDYLLYDEYLNDSDIPAVKNTSDEMKKEENRRIAFIVCIGLLAALECFAVVSWVLFQKLFFVSNAVIGQIFALIAFEAAYKKYQYPSEAAGWRMRYYRYAVWLIAYFPVRFILSRFWALYPRPMYSLWIEGSYVLAYLLVCGFVTWRLSHAVFRFP